MAGKTGGGGFWDRSRRVVWLPRLSIQHTNTRGQAGGAGPQLPRQDTSLDDGWNPSKGQLGCQSLAQALTQAWTIGAQCTLNAPLSGFLVNGPEGFLLGPGQVVLGQEGEVLAVNDTVGVEVGLRIKFGFAGPAAEAGLQRFNIGIVNHIVVVYIAVP